MESQEGRRTAAPLAQRVAKDANAEQIASALVATWQEIDAALAPILGRHGVAALYKRSIHLTGATHPWLANTHKGLQTTIDFVALKSEFAQQSSADAASAGSALLHTFYDLLTSLVGLSLTERLLRSVWANTSRGPPAQDTSP